MIDYYINLQLFAESSGEKTEKATQKKRREARKKGQVLQSREFTSALVLLFVFIVPKLFGSFIYSQITGYTTELFTDYSREETIYSIGSIRKLGINTMMLLIKVMLPVFAAAVVTGVAISYAQVGFLLTTETLMFKLERINPLSGLKRIFSMRGFAELLKSLLKITIIGYMVYSFINSEALGVMKTMELEVMSSAAYIANTTLSIGIKICIALIVFGAADYFYQWYEYEKSLKMTKQEVKEEYKQTEGNPEIKSKIKQRQRQMSMSRMLQEVPKADVVITNPTHFAVAVKYDEALSEAPLVTGKGQDYLALRIREIAEENSIEIVENKMLARTLYDTVDVGESIPPELYQAVAEILAYVYNLKGVNR